MTKDDYEVYTRSLAERNFNKFLEGENLKDFLMQFDEETKTKILDVWWSAYYWGYLKYFYKNDDLVGGFKKWEKDNRRLIGNLFNDFTYNYLNYIYIYYCFFSGIEEGRKAFGRLDMCIYFDGLKDKFRRSSKEIRDKISSIIAYAFFEKEIKDGQFEESVVNSIYDQVISYILKHLK